MTQPETQSSLNDKTPCRGLLTTAHGRNLRITHDDKLGPIRGGNTVDGTGVMLPDSTLLTFNVLTFSFRDKDKSHRRPCLQITF